MAFAKGDKVRATKPVKDGKTVTVRDAEGDTVMYTLAEWRAFVEGVKLGEFDI